MRAPLIITSALACTLALACGDGSSTSDGSSSDATAGGTDSPTTGEFVIDEAKIVAEVLAFDQGGYTKVNTTQLKSQHAANMVDIWVRNDLTDLYYMIDPANPGPKVTFPAGATLIKHHFNSEGASDGWTVMVKGPADYDPDAFGWWWARMLASGKFASGGGTEYKGNVDFCVSCHAASPDTDYVRGIDGAVHAGP